MNKNLTLVDDERLGAVTAEVQRGEQPHHTPHHGSQHQSESSKRINSKSRQHKDPSECSKRGERWLSRGNALFCAGRANSPREKTRPEGARAKNKENNKQKKDKDVIIKFDVRLPLG